MCSVNDSEARALVAAARQAASEHGSAWSELVPTVHVVNRAAEAGEEAAYLAMVEAKRRLRDHIVATYGLSPGELAGLAIL